MKEIKSAKKVNKDPPKKIHYSKYIVETLFSKNVEG